MIVGSGDTEASWRCAASFQSIVAPFLCPCPAPGPASARRRLRRKIIKPMYSDSIDFQSVKTHREGESDPLAIIFLFFATFAGFPPSPVLIALIPGIQIRSFIARTPQARGAVREGVSKNVSPIKRAFCSNRYTYMIAQSASRIGHGQRAPEHVPATRFRRACSSDIPIN